MASVEAVLRRRLNRKARHASREEKARQRAEKEREIAVRLKRRFFGEDEVIYACVLDWRYWQARRCGWDALAAEVRGKYLGADGKCHLYHPSESPFWYWWTRLHHENRNRLVCLSTFRVFR